ncbi:MAG: inorganic phosphate transporter [Muribaculaceae bacterium]|nr:inorganic phosphate transporter [Muribaculaceae bacterium]
MDILFLCIVVFLFLLAIFDLSVGVSNDAVNFLNSAIGSKAASFKRILIVASIGVFIGAAMSNGMMDIARHGIFRPEHFSFYDLICIFMAVMVTDIILLDVFNSLGMPTSTTVSMVFELLGATFVVALIKMAGGIDLGFNDLLNTEKALSVILGIFLSVAIAFFFGTVVQFLSRLIFSFNYRSKLKWKIGIFGGLCATAIIYFLLLKGAKDLTFMTPEVKGYIKTHTWQILGICMVFFTLLMQALHWMKVNVLKVIVLLGTFALAMAFAGNDLVNFIGVPLSGLASYQDYIANGHGDAQSFLMGSLNGPANTPVYFLIGAGVIMVVSLATSRKARNVTKTEIGLGSQQGGDEMFGSSRIARRLVRWTLRFLAWVRRVTPLKVRQWFNRRFNVDETIMDQGAAFDLLRGSVNLVLAGALIALGTSLKLPLSTTFVTFMVAMGTSLADRAWGRESAVFRITGVISVIGGWFITAGAAFIGAGLIVLLMHFGGHWVMIALALVTIFLIIRSNRRFKARKEEEKGDAVFNSILASEDKNETWNLLLLYIGQQQQGFLLYAGEMYDGITQAFLKENVRALGKAASNLERQKNVLKNVRRKETLCLRKVAHETALEKNPWFHLSNNCLMSVLYNLRRIDEICKEHVENNFRPLPQRQTEEFELIRTRIGILFNDIQAMMESGTTATVPMLRLHCDEIKDAISDVYHGLHDQLHDGDPASMTVFYVYMNMLSETQEMISAVRKYLRAYAKLRDSEFRSRPAGRPRAASAAAASTTTGQVATTGQVNAPESK